MLLLCGGRADHGGVVERRTDAPEGVDVLAMRLRDRRTHALLQALLQVGACPPDLSVSKLQGLVEQPCSSPLCLAWPGLRATFGSEAAQTRHGDRSRTRTHGQDAAVRRRD